MDFLNALLDWLDEKRFSAKRSINKLIWSQTVDQEATAVEAATETPKEEKDIGSFRSYRDFDRPSYRPPSPYAPGGYYAETEHLQVSHQTKYNRFPKIFDSARILKPDAKRILSFGCSTGEECQRLAELFPSAEIVGVDIDEYSIKTARKKNRFPERIFFHTDLGATGTYDLALVLMVLFSLEQPIPKERFIKVMEKIDKYINPNGILMVFCSEYSPKEVPQIANYEAFNEWTHQHNKNNKDYFAGYYRKRSPEEVGLNAWRLNEIELAKTAGDKTDEPKAEEIPAPEELAMLKSDAVPIVKPEVSNPWVNKDGVEDVDDYDASTGGILPKEEKVVESVPSTHY